MAEHCGRFPVDFRGRPVSLIPELRECLVLLSTDQAAKTSTFKCSICDQAWEEEYTTTRHGENVRVRKVNAVGPITLTDPELVSEAIIVWTGIGHATWPGRDEARLTERFGDAALDLLPLVKRLEDDFFESDARTVAGDLVEMGDLAADRFRRHYPEIREEAVEALAWCYTFTYK